MTEAQNIKVYELAKELGFDSISLVEKLTSINIKVKNHMSDLTPEMVSQAKAAFQAATQAAAEASTKGTATKKTTVTRTKTTVKKAATPESSAAPVEVKKVTRASAKTAEPKTPAPQATATSTVIRRRVKSTDEASSLESVVIQGGHESSPTIVATAEATTHTPIQTAHTAETSVTHTPHGTDDTHGIEKAPDALQKALHETITASPTHPSTAETPTTPATEVNATAPVTTETTSEAAPVTVTKPVITLTPRPVAARKSILTVVDAPKMPPRVPRPTPTKGPTLGANTGTQGKNSAFKGTTQQDKDGFRIIKMTKENLDQMEAEESSKRKGAGRGEEMSINPLDIRFADYRKKEMVFLPKKKRIQPGKELKHTQITTPKAIKRVVEMGETISVQEFASQLGVKANEIIKKLMMMGTMATINQAIDLDTATILATEYQWEVKNISFDETTVIDHSQDLEEDLTPRPPVVTIMGHVDHGKTSLLDAIREANVASGEAGGITQHIGAYTVEKSGKLITFIDTPGHEAFTIMRARGANVTDIVILVVSADDGVMPQTREALSHSKAAGVPIIVAMNKIDKPGANPEKIKQQLAELDLLSEDWGGQTMFIPVSALKKTNLDKLLEAILLQAEVLELKGNLKARASGTVLEVRLEKGRGPVASVLVKRGTLKIGDPIVSGQISGKVKALMNDRGQNVKEALPGIAVEVLGFEGLPDSGDKFDAPINDQAAREIVENRLNKQRAAQAQAGTKTSLEDLFAKIQAGVSKELSIILKADVFGSVEAVRDSLLKLTTEKVKVKVLLAAPGGITESDVRLAQASDALIIGFNVRPETKARQIAENEGIEIKCYNIIYELLDDVKNSMSGLLDKKKVERFLGRAEVRQTFTVPKAGTIAGSFVIDGKISRGASVRLLRDSRVVWEGTMDSLRRFKDDAKEVQQGYECGIGLQNYNDVKVGDIIEAFTIDLVDQELGQSLSSVNASSSTSGNTSGSSEAKA